MALRPFEFTPVAPAPAPQDQVDPDSYKPVLAEEPVQTADQEQSQALQYASNAEILRTADSTWDPDVEDYYAERYGPIGVEAEPAPESFSYPPSAVEEKRERAEEWGLGSALGSLDTPTPLMAPTGLGGAQPEAAALPVSAPLTRISPLRDKVAAPPPAPVSKPVFASDDDFQSSMEQAEVNTLAEAKTRSSGKMRLKGTITNLKSFNKPVRSNAPEAEPVAEPAAEQTASSPVRMGFKIKDDTVDTNIRPEMDDGIQMVADMYKAAGIPADQMVMTDGVTKRDQFTFHDIGLGADFRWVDLDKAAQTKIMKQLDDVGHRPRKSSKFWVLGDYEVRIHKEAGSEIHFHIEHEKSKPELVSDWNSRHPEDQRDARGKRK